MASHIASLPLLSRVRSKSGCVSVGVQVRSTYLGPKALSSHREAAPFNMSFRQQILSIVKDKESQLFSRLQGDFGPQDDDLPDICVTETKCTPSLFWKTNIFPEPEPPEPGFFVVAKDIHYVTFSPKEDGTMLSKDFDIFPYIEMEDDSMFTGCSCNGILYLTEEGTGHVSGHALFNPTTLEYKILPETIVESHFEWLDQSFGMGFDHRSEDFKLLHFVETERDYHIHLYSLKTNSWKRLPLPSTDEFAFNCVFLRSSACINGVFYCTATPKGTPNGNHGVILAFDLTSETFSTLPLPENSWYPFCFIDYKGLLGACDCSLGEDYLDPSTRDYELWIMRDGSWTRESIFHTRNTNGCGSMKLLQFSRDGKLVYFAIYSTDIMVYNRATRKLKSLGVYRGTGYLQMAPFVESFVQLNGITCNNS